MDVVLTLKIPEGKVAIALEGFLSIYPNIETIDDPTWVDPDDGSTANQIPKYTTKEWVTEKIRRNTVRDIRRGLQIKANAAAQVENDDGIIESQ